MQNITLNSSTRTSTRNRSSNKKTEGRGANKDDWAVDDNPLSNLTPTQIRQKARDMLKVNERLVEQISELNSMNSQLQQYLYNKAIELKFQESHKNEQLKDVVLDNDARIKEIQEIHSAYMTKNNSELSNIALAWQYDKKASNPVSIFCVIDQSLTRTRVVPAPDGTICLVDINSTRYLGSI